MTRMPLLCSLSYLILALLLGSCAPPLLAPPSVAGQPGAALTVAAPAIAPVSTLVSIIVTSSGLPDGTSVDLLLIGTYAPQLLTASLEGGTARFTAAPPWTSRSGTVSILATAGPARATTQFTLIPGLPVEPLIPLIGSKTIEADGNHWSNVTVLPVDRLGNPVDTGTPVRTRVRHPTGSTDEKLVSVKHLVAWMRIFSGTRAGRTTVGVQSRAAYGPEDTLTEYAGRPDSITVSNTPVTLPADGRSLMLLRTDLLQDRYANPVPDGTLVTFVVDGLTGDQRRIPALTIAGVAEAPLQAPLQSGLVNVTAIVGTVASRPIHIAFTPGLTVETFPIAVARDEPNGVLRIHAGPLLGPLKQYIPDGTPVEFSVTGRADLQETQVVQVQEGHATARIPLARLPSGSYIVAIVIGSSRESAQFVIP
ncbi:MAG: hypothetical protein NVS4B8_01470 [Herpetosiphon sp.]